MATAEAIRPFFELLGERCQRIEAVAMDMNTAFDLEVKRHCPQAEVVYDLFHVVARYGREVIDRIRVDQANLLRDDKPVRKVVKQSRWLLLRNRENLKDGQAVRLQELLAANQPLATVYVLKDALKDVWYAPAYERAGGAGEVGCGMLGTAVWRRSNALPGICANTPVASSQAPASPAHQRPGRREQPHQGDQADGLWLPGL